MFLVWMFLVAEPVIKALSGSIGIFHPESNRLTLNFQVSEMGFRTVQSQRCRAAM